MDGVLGLHGGAELREACRRVPVRDGVELVGGGGNAVGGYGVVRCPVGTAVSTPACGSAVREHYDTVVHTVPPLWPGCGGSKWSVDTARRLLRSCYVESLDTALRLLGADVVRLPLLGAGARRTPLDEAVNCLVEGVAQGVAQGVVQGVAQGVVQGVVQGPETGRGPGSPVYLQIVVLDSHVADLLVGLFGEQLKGQEC